MVARSQETTKSGFAVILLGFRTPSMVQSLYAQLRLGWDLQSLSLQATYIISREKNSKIGMRCVTEKPDIGRIW